MKLTEEIGYSKNSDRSYTAVIECTCTLLRFSKTATIFSEKHYFLPTENYERHCMIHEPRTDQAVHVVGKAPASEG